jgi:hypothetical protein
MPEIDVLHPDHCRIWVLAGPNPNALEGNERAGPWSNALDAVRGIGMHMLAFRRGRQPDSRAVFDWLAVGTPPPARATVERAAFGLPLPFRYINGGPTDVLEGDKGADGSKIERRRSPLLLRVQQLAANQFVGVAVLFKSQFLPDARRMRFRASGLRLPPPKNYDLLEDFVTSEFNALEVAFA